MQLCEPLGQCLSRWPGYILASHGRSEPKKCDNSSKIYRTQKFNNRQFHFTYCFLIYQTKYLSNLIRKRTESTYLIMSLVRKTYQTLKSDWKYRFPIPQAQNDRKLFLTEITCLTKLAYGYPQKYAFPSTFSATLIC